MARDFTAASSQYLNYAAAIKSSLPFSFSCWVNLDDATAEQSIFSINNAGTTGYFRLTVEGGALIGWQQQDSGADIDFPSTASVTTATWYNCCVVFETTTNRYIYVNGADKVISTDSIAVPTGLDITLIGAWHGALLENFVDGRIAEVAVWDVALGDADAAALAKAVSPSLVRPASLVAYWPLIGKTSPEIDIVGGAGMSLVNAPAAAAHCRVFYPRWPILGVPTAAAPVNITPPQGNLALSPTAPAVVQTTTENELPARVDLTLSMTAPTVAVDLPLSPARVDLTLTGTAPLLHIDLTLEPARADLALSMTAPTVDQTTSEDESPTAADLALSTTAPEVTVGTATDLTPARADLTLTGTAPTVEQTTTVDLSPARADLALSTTAPTVAVLYGGSRDFNGTTQYLTHATQPALPLPVTIGCWAFSDSDSTLQFCMHLTCGINNSGHQLFLAGATAGDPIRAQSVLTAVVGGASSSLTGYGIVGWHSGVGVFTSTTSRLVYLDGVAGTENTTSVSPGTPSNGIRIGARRTATHDFFMNGRLARAFVLDIAATASEIARFAAGEMPQNIWPADNIKGNWPILGQDSPETDISGNGFHLTLVAAPPAFNAQPPILIVPPQSNTVLSATVPTIDQTTVADLSPAADDLVLTGTAPDLAHTTSEDKSPATVDLVLSTTAPSVDVQTTSDLVPARAELTLTGTAPAVDQTTSEDKVPAADDLLISTFAPTVVVTENVGLSPAAAQLLLSQGATGFPPDVVDSGAGVVVGAGARRGLLLNVGRGINP